MARVCVRAQGARSHGPRAHRRLGAPCALPAWPGVRAWCLRVLPSTLPFASSAPPSPPHVHASSLSLPCCACAGQPVHHGLQEQHQPVRGPGARAAGPQVRRHNPSLTTYHLPDGVRPRHFSLQNASQPADGAQLQRTLSPKPACVPSPCAGSATCPTTSTTLWCSACIARRRRGCGCTPPPRTRCAAQTLTMRA